MTARYWPFRILVHRNRNYFRIRRINGARAIDWAVTENEKKPNESRLNEAIGTPNYSTRILERKCTKIKGIARARPLCPVQERRDQQILSTVLTQPLPAPFPTRQSHRHRSKQMWWKSRIRQQQSIDCRPTTIWLKCRPVNSWCPVGMCRNAAFECNRKWRPLSWRRPVTSKVCCKNVASDWRRGTATSATR